MDFDLLLSSLDTLIECGSDRDLSIKLKIFRTGEDLLESQVFRSAQPRTPEESFHTLCNVDRFTTSYQYSPKGRYDEKRCFTRLLDEVGRQVGHGTCSQGALFYYLIYPNTVTNDRAIAPYVNEKF